LIFWDPIQPNLPESATVFKRVWQL